MDWRTSGQVSFDTWARVLEELDSPIRFEGRKAYEAAGDLSALCLAMMIHESRAGTHFNRNKEANQNALNLKFRNTNSFIDYPSWTDGIKAWRARITDPTYKGGVYAKTTTVADLINVYAPPNDDNDTPAYIAAVEGMINDWIGDQGGPTVPNRINVNFRASIIPPGSSNRPGFLLNTDDRIIGITQHTTGNKNPGADAEMHRLFVHQGGGSDNVSFHFVVDDYEVIQLLPLYEGAYHAADGCDNRATDIGCFDTVAIELCVNNGANWMKAKDNLAKLYAMLWAKDPRIIGIDRVDVSPDRTTTHQKVSDTNKYCPTEILNEGSLPTIIAQGKEYAMLVPEQVYVKPIVPSWLANDNGRDIYYINQTKTYPVHLTYTAIQDTPRKQATGRNHNEVGPPIKEGEVFAAGRAYRSAGVTYVLTDYGTRVIAAHLLPKVQISASGTVSVRYE